MAYLIGPKKVEWTPMANSASVLATGDDQDVPYSGVHQRLVPLARDVIVVVIEPSRRNLLGGGKGVQLVVRLVADQVRPHPAVRRPAWRVDQDAHAATAQPVSISPA